MTVAERVADHLHPRLAALQAERGGQDGFWAEIARDRAPLVEPDPDHPGQSLVTFVYPAPDGAGHVVVNPGYGAQNPADHLMDAIAGTNVRHATYRYRNDVRTTYNFAADLPLTPFDEASDEDMAAMLAFMREHPPQPDPHAREQFASSAGEGNPDLIASFLSLPDAPEESLVQRRPDVAHGRIDRHQFTSALMGNERRVWVYTPPGYADSEVAYPVLVAFDGGMGVSSMAVHRTLDNLLAEGRIRPLVAVFVDNATETSRNDELPCSETFARCLEEELLPWLRGAYRVSTAPEDHYVTGVSYGGLASMWMGYRLPHVFGNVIAQAPSLWWGPGYVTTRNRKTQSYPAGWLIDQYEASTRLPVRFWMEMGLMEHPQLMQDPARRMLGVLQAKGYDVAWSEPCGGHDSALWRGTLGLALARMAPPEGASSSRSPHPADAVDAPA